MRMQEKEVTTQLDMINSRMLERIAKALERIASALEAANEQQAD